MDTTKEIIDDEIYKLADGVSDINDSEARSEQVESIAKLRKIEVEREKAEAEIEMRQKELESQERQTKSQNIVRYVGYGVEIGLAVISLIAFESFKKQGFKFEEEGSYTSTTFRTGITQFFKKFR